MLYAPTVNASQVKFARAVLGALPPSTVELVFVDNIMVVAVTGRTFTVTKMSFTPEDFARWLDNQEILDYTDPFTVRPNFCEIHIWCNLTRSSKRGAILTTLIGQVASVPGWSVSTNIAADKQFSAHSGDLAFKLDVTLALV